MRVEIVCDGKVLPSATHRDGKTYVEAPKKGAYVVRLRNDGPTRKLAVLSVDGVNVLDGTDAGYSGPGYVLRPWETVEVPGWRRSGSEVAAFELDTKDKSYAARTGRGQKNAGVVGVAVFDEAVKVEVPQIIVKEHHHHYPRPRPWRLPWPWSGIKPYWGGVDLDSGNGWSTGTYCSTNSEPVSASVGRGEPLMSFSEADTMATNASSPLRAKVVHNRRSSGPSGSSAGSTRSIVNVGTVYGKKTEFHTADTSFERASEKPSEVIVLHYATRERLKSWGIVVKAVDAKKGGSPEAFPASVGAVPAPSGWRG